MQIAVLGADGYLGWPTALHLSARGHDVIAIDNLIRRRWDREGGTHSLVPIGSMANRVGVWEAVSGRRISWMNLDVCDMAGMSAAIRGFRPDAVVHFAEQRSAPYSMISAGHAVETQVNNVVGTLSLLFAIRDNAPDCHIVKLGTMGEYGTPNIDIEEGWLDVEHNGRTDRVLYPKRPGSFYHLSKVHDSHNLEFACRAWGLRTTDLNQGVVYGMSTAETDADRRLATRFDYDDVWGTALNRFCVQAAIGHPLTVYGTGGQTRGFLDVRDTVRCIELAILNPADAGEFRVFNQFTEQFSILELANRVQAARAAHGLETEIDHLPNPRVELESHYYSARHQHLLDLGLEPHRLEDTLIESVIVRVEKLRRRVRDGVILPRVDWRGREQAWRGTARGNRQRVRHLVGRHKPLDEAPVAVGARQAQTHPHKVTNGASNGARPRP
ncbi:MAG TPA: NAD-dependent epimerase/dehydratase family protein [Candidatus Dormibacteraeota bacterium]|nr:NAD-dependent epimerase/dehydratase family protein [Candidatus Dormibacteraeota bacterium]